MNAGQLPEGGRREPLRRIARAAVAAPVIMVTSEVQAGLVFWLARLFGQDSAIGRWLLDPYLRW